MGFLMLKLKNSSFTRSITIIATILSEEIMWFIVPSRQQLFQPMRAMKVLKQKALQMTKQLTLPTSTLMTANHLKIS
jgi:uncharacterized membrane protein